jgi:hypothetical protein
MTLPSLEPIHPLRGAEKLASSAYNGYQRKVGLSKHKFSPVVVPYCLPLPTEATNWKVAFAPPSEITLVGSWATDTAIRGRDGAPFGVDIAVEMPAVCALIVYIITLYSCSVLVPLPRERLSQWSLLPEARILSRMLSLCLHPL